MKRAIFSVFWIVGLAFIPSAASSEGTTPSPRCAPSSEIQEAIEKVVGIPFPDRATFEQKMAPFGALRDRFPKDLFVQMRYQDAVNEYGVEGHLKLMAREYAGLRNAHSNDPFYLYLYGRGLEGRVTRQGIATMAEVLKRDPGFAMAHRTLAEIYGAASFRDRKKEESERAKFLAACPGAPILQEPSSPASQGHLLDEAEALLRQDPDDHRVADLVYQAFQQDEWRLQRTRPFDWYSVDQKRRVGRELRLAYWRGWHILVEHNWKKNQSEKAKQLLAEMQTRLERTRAEKDPELFWMGASTLLDLYAKGAEWEKARQVLGLMERGLSAKPDRKRSAELTQVRAKLARRERAAQTKSQ